MHPPPMTMNETRGPRSVGGRALCSLLAACALVACGPQDVPATSVDAATPSDASMDSRTDADAGTSPRLFRVLFDTSHRNSVSNADWVVDHSGVEPTPADPSSELDWSGGVSAWGFGLYQSGRYVIRQLVPGTRLSFGEGGPTDLATYDVFISVEPEEPFSPNERSALSGFANNGGGIFMVADHAGAQRCTSCTEAWRVINVALSASPLSDTFGVRCDGNSIARSGTRGSDTMATDLGMGPFGHASTLEFHAGTTVSLTGTNENAAIAVRAGQQGMLVTSSVPSGGRLVLLGDSSPADDGTCSGCGATLFDGWSESDDASWILNATAWLARDGG